MYIYIYIIRDAKRNKKEEKDKIKPINNKKKRKHVVNKKMKSNQRMNKKMKKHNQIYQKCGLGMSNEQVESLFKFIKKGGGKVINK